MMAQRSGLKAWKNFPNLIRVPEKLMDNDFIANSKGRDLNTKDWSTLASFDIAYILGWQIFKNNLVGHKSTICTKDVG